MTFNRASFPVILGKERCIKFELASNVVDDGLGNVMPICRKTPFMLKGFEQECTPKPTGTDFTAKNRYLLLNKGKMLNKFFNIPLALHLQKLPTAFTSSKWPTVITHQEGNHSGL